MTNNEKHFIKIAQKLNDLQIYTFCITQKDDEELLKLCQDNLQVDNPSDNIKLEKTILFLSYQYIVYFIISLVHSKINNVLLKY
ncbi:MAG: hypothetical protein LUG12_08895 [Erysipelotrichaceae bacterium]|nr:hypothetical protein [Erysipelotrichaceae bacterium]